MAIPGANQDICVPSTEANAISQSLSPVSKRLCEPVVRPMPTRSTSRHWQSSAVSSHNDEYRCFPIAKIYWFGHSFDSLDTWLLIIINVRLVLQRNAMWNDYRLKAVDPIGGPTLEWVLTETRRLTSSYAELRSDYYCRQTERASDAVQYQRTWHQIVVIGRCIWSQSYCCHRLFPKQCVFKFCLTINVNKKCLKIWLNIFEFDWTVIDIKVIICSNLSWVPIF